MNKNYLMVGFALPAVSVICLWLFIGFDDMAEKILRGKSVIRKKGDKAHNN